MRQGRRRGGTIGFLAAALMLCSLVPAAAQTPLHVIVFQGMQNLPLLAAQAEGFFTARGLTVDLQVTPNSEAMRNGLAQGRYQIAHGAVDNAIAMAEVAHVAIAVVLGGDNGFNRLLFQPDIPSYAALKGKTVIVDAPNTAYALVLYRMLQQHGLKRGDYGVKEVGATYLRLQAMKQDKTDAATIMNPPFSLLGEAAGLKNMGAAVDAIGPYQATAGFVLRAWARQNRETLVRYIAAYVEGLRWVMDRRHQAEAAGLLAAALHLTPEMAQRCYDIATAPKGGFTKNAVVDVAGLGNVLKLRAAIEGQWGGKPPPAARYLDLTYYRQALRGG